MFNSISYRYQQTNENKKKLFGPSSQYKWEKSLLVCAIVRIRYR